nr:MAG TPA: hypothetical protein [Caudoviricetes sp.]
MNNEGHYLWNPRFPILSCCHILTVFCETFVFTSFVLLLSLNAIAIFVQPIVFPFLSTYNAFAGTDMPSIMKGELYG